MRGLLVLVLTLALMTGSALGSLAFWQALLGGGSSAGAGARASAISSSAYALNNYPLCFHTLARGRDSGLLPTK
ncbi:GL16827 [Drosophila persimilis]|uniref:GL16827 n=1 Tax=Drosophila persimilis TaxID=7234 RepID=B4GI43_DROPE|nr:GL16827 [Drosophila persimilis]